MEDRDVLDFVTAMCATGEAGRYGYQSQELAATSFADDIAGQAVERFGEGRELLQRVKGRLKTFCDRVLRHQLEATFGQSCVGDVGGRYAGIYLWTVALPVAPGTTSPSKPNLQLKFGPSAWYANEQDTLEIHCGQDRDRLLAPVPHARRDPTDPPVGTDTSGDTRWHPDQRPQTARRAQRVVEVRRDH